MEGARQEQREVSPQVGAEYGAAPPPVQQSYQPDYAPPPPSAPEAAAPHYAQQAQPVYATAMPVHHPPVGGPPATPPVQPAQPVYAMPVPAGGLPPAGHVPPGQKAGGLSRNLQWARMAQLLLRMLTLVFSLISFAVIASLNESRTLETSDETAVEYKAKWTDSKAAEFLFSIMLITFLITLPLLAFVLLELLKKAPSGHYAKWAALAFIDVVLASLVFGAACGVLVYLDASEDFAGTSVCDVIKSICSKSRAGAAFAFLTWFTLLGTLLVEMAVMATGGFSR